jgi:hypothetical protein
LKRLKAYTGSAWSWLFVFSFPLLSLYGLILVCSMPEQQQRTAQKAAVQQRATIERLAARHAAYTLDRAKAQAMPDMAVVAPGDQGIGSEHHSTPGVYSLVELSTGNHIAYAVS